MKFYGGKIISRNTNFRPLRVLCVPFNLFARLTTMTMIKCSFLSSFCYRAVTNCPSVYNGVALQKNLVGANIMAVNNCCLYLPVPARTVPPRRQEPFHSRILHNSWQMNIVVRLWPLFGYRYYTEHPLAYNTIHMAKIYLQTWRAIH
jgi:hypothetical protein